MLYLIFLMYLIGFLWLKFIVIPDFDFELNYTTLVYKLFYRIFIGICFVFSPAFIILAIIGALVLGVCYIVGLFTQKLFGISNGPPDIRHLQGRE